MFKLNRIIFLIILSFAFFLADNFGILNFVRNPLDGTIIPMKKNIFGIYTAAQDFGKVVSSYSKISNILKQKNELTQKNEELELLNDKLTQENLKIRSLLDAPFPSSFKFVPARVIALSRFLEIDIGEESGVRKDQIVIIGQTLVGKVMQVFSKRSRIILVSDPDFRINAVTQRGARGEISGQTNNIILFSKVLQKEPLFLSDLVQTTGEEFIPAGLLIGKITFINQKDTSSYKDATVESPINSKDTKIVFVVTSL